MKTIEINLYKFSELSEDAKQKVLESLAHINVDDDWWEFIYEDAERVELKITGFDTGRAETIGIEFTDTARVTAEAIVKEHGDVCDSHKLATEFLSDWDKLVEKYSDGKNPEVVTEDNEDEFDSEADELEKEFLKDIGCDYLMSLRNEYDYKIGEEAIIETIEANEYDFTKDGKMY